MKCSNGTQTSGTEQKRIGHIGVVRTTLQPISYTSYFEPSTSDIPFIFLKLVLRLSVQYVVSKGAKNLR
jgi:hypothetical protein